MLTGQIDIWGHIDLSHEIRFDGFPSMRRTRLVYTVGGAIRVSILYK